MNEELKQLAKLNDENIELKREIQRLNESMRGYARLQIKKDRDRILQSYYENDFSDLNELIKTQPIKLDKW